MNPAGPGEECMACTARTARTVSRIDKVPCLRSNLLHLRLFVTDFWLEDHNWSHRWPSGGRRENITAWASSDTRTIQVTHDYSANILELEVREFVPIEKDMLCMQWEDRGIIKSVLLPMYAVADTFTATKIYKRYIGQESPQVFNSTVNENERLLRETYKIAITTSKAAKVRYLVLVYSLADDSVTQICSAR
jgi:hypothetical protein